MAPTPSTAGLTILPRTVCYNRHGCGSSPVPKDKLPLIISVAVIVVLIVIAILCCSLRLCGRQKQNPTRWNWLSSGSDPNTAPHAVRVPAPTLRAGPTGAGGVIRAGTGTGAGGTGAIGAAAGAVATSEPVQPTTTTTWRVPEGGLPPLVPPPMYEETPPPPTYQRGAGPPVRRGEMAPSYA